jgi:hypothetical protein
MTTCRYINSGQSNFKFEYLGEIETEFENILGQESGGQVVSIHEKNQRSKISCYCPFKATNCKLPNIVGGPLGNAPTGCWRLLGQCQMGFAHPFRKTQIVLGPCGQCLQRSRDILRHAQIKVETVARHVCRCTVDA